MEAAQSQQATRLTTLLTTRTFGRSLRWLDTVGSTNTIGSEWAAGDAPDGSVVVAELQTAGRGRFDRSWSARKGQNLTFSVILFPGISADRLGLIPVAFSVAVAFTLRRVPKIGEVEIKWPNDILVDGAKICGMLQESAMPADGGSKRVVVGVGLNVNQTDFPPEIADGATSLRLATGEEHDRASLLADLLAEMEDAYYAIHKGGESKIRSRYEAMLGSLGKQVSYVRPGDNVSTDGVVTGVDARGGLVVATATGRETVYAGDVSFGME